MPLAPVCKACREMDSPASYRVSPVGGGGQDRRGVEAAAQRPHTGDARLTGRGDTATSAACSPRRAWKSPELPAVTGQGGPMHSTARVIALLGRLSCAAAAARAQYPQRRDGFWIGFGLGYGSANITCDNCVDSSSVGGITGFVKLGGAPSRNLLIGGALNGWARTNAGLKGAKAQLTRAAFLYPAPP